MMFSGDGEVPLVSTVFLAVIGGQRLGSFCEFTQDTYFVLYEPR